MRLRALQRSRSRASFLLGWICLLAATGGARAWALIPSDGTNLVEMLVGRALEKHALEREPEPEGKEIEDVVIEINDVFLSDDTLLGFANQFHFLTRERTIREELLLRPGDRYEERFARETARNLRYRDPDKSEERYVREPARRHRTQLQVSVAQVVACKGSVPGKVKLLIVTRDLWSLRVSFDLQLTDGRLEYLWVGLLENNWLGHAEVISPFILEMDQRAVSFTQRYRNPRLGWSRIGLREQGGPILNHQTWALEGATFEAQLGSPLESLSRRWAWEIETSLVSRVKRTFSQGDLARESVGGAGERLPLQYDEAAVRLDAVLVRSYGYEVKHNFALGWRLNAPYYRFRGLPGEDYSTDAIEDFNARFLPFQDRFSQFYLQYSLFEGRFQELMNIETMGLVEDVRLGPQGIMELGFEHRALGMESSFLQPRVTFAWNRAWGADSLSVVRLDGTFRYQWSPIGVAQPWVNQLYSLDLKHSFPSLFGIGRWVWGARVNLRWEDLSRQISTVGGNNFLRGFPSGYFQGPSLWGMNLEFRSLPWRPFRYFLLGAVLFADTGGTFRTFGDLAFNGSLGTGVRVMLPQANRSVMRIDLGFPIGAGLGPSTTLQFEQAF